MKKETDKGFSGLSSMVSNIDPILTDEEILDTGVQGAGDMEESEDNKSNSDLMSTVDEVTIKQDVRDIKPEQGANETEVPKDETIHIGPQHIQKPSTISKIFGVGAILFVVLVGSIYAYQTYSYNNSPEKTVRDFYAAYFSKDYNTVASNLSVFWAVRFLPDYQDKNPAELLAERSQIEKEITAVITEIEVENTLPEGLDIKVLPKYTKIGTNGALVVYDFLEKGQPTSREAALLINEKGQFRIFNMSPIDYSLMEEIKNFSIEDLDAGFATLLQS